MDPKGPSPGEVTRLLTAWGEGDASARDQLIPLIYGDLRRQAAAHLRRERREHTLRPTDLVHETYLRLRAQNAAWDNRHQLFVVAAQLMRRILVDHARRRAAAKRGGGLQVTLGEEAEQQAAAAADLLDVDVALQELAVLDERQAQLVELRFFGGSTLEEAADALGVSRATAARDWATAKSWLFRRLKQLSR